MIHFQKVHGKFHPIYKSDHEVWESLKENVTYEAKITKVRNKSDIKLFKKYWGLMRLIYEQTEDTFYDIKNVSDWMKLKCNLFEIIEQRGEKVFFKPKSIAWENMSADEFEQYWNRFIQVACKLLNCTEYEINENLVF